MVTAELFSHSGRILEESASKLIQVISIIYLLMVMDLGPYLITSCWLEAAFKSKKVHEDLTHWELP